MMVDTTPFGTRVLVTPTANSVFVTHRTASSEYILFGESLDSNERGGGIELKHVSAINARWLREIAPHYWAFGHY